MNELNNYSSPPRPAFSIVSVLAVVCATFSFRNGAGLGFILAVFAIVLGAVGVVVAVLPGKRGGLISLFSIAAGAIGIVAAVFKLIGNVLG